MHQIIFHYGKICLALSHFITVKSFVLIEIKNTTLKSVLQVTCLIILSLKSPWYLAKCQEQSWPINEGGKKVGRKKRFFVCLPVTDIIQASLI